jgi:competence protein ComEC
MNLNRLKAGLQPVKLRMPNRQQMPTRAPALYLLVGIIVGLCVAREVAAPIGLALGVAFALTSLSLLHSTGRSKWLWLFIFLAAATLTFWAYGTIRLPAKPDSAELNMPIREAHLHFEVERVMQARNLYDKATGIGRIVEANKASRLERGEKVYFRLKLPDADAPEVQRGSELRATGVLTAIPHAVEPDSFESYLKDTGIHYRFERSSELELVRSPSRFDQFCQDMNVRFQDYLRLGAPNDSTLDGIYIAMLLGLKTELSDEQKDRFRMTGTMHFFAISGLHIGVIATVIAQFLILIRLPRKISPFIGLPLLYLYVEITGAPPSAVRAFLMALFFWASFAFTRQRSPLAALAASAVFVLIIAPEQLWSIGFQLSYTVVLSILLFGLPLYETASEKFAPFSYLPKASWAPSQHLYAWVQDALLLLFAISGSAWLASAPLSAAFFGYLSPGAILLNMMLVNLAAITISAGVISLALSTIGLESMAAFINHAAWMTIYAMDRLVAWSTEMPGMIIHSEGFIEWIAYATLILYFALLFWLHRARNYRRAALWVLPPAVIVAGLMYGLILE